MDRTGGFTLFEIVAGLALAAPVTGIGVVRVPAVVGPIRLAGAAERLAAGQMKELLKLYGMGPATVRYLLFDVFHHWDFFNHVSPWEQKIYSKLFFDQDPEHPVEVGRILEHFEKFGCYKQMAVHYIWEDLWWKRKNGQAPWLEPLIRT